jgi:hypothetical protein
MAKLAPLVIPFLLMTGCAARRKPATHVQPVADIQVGPNCVMGALANSKSCEVVKVGNVQALLCDRVVIKLACIPAPKKSGGQ